MRNTHWLAGLAVCLLASSAEAQIIRGVMTVTGAEMHWWAGVARDATARLYDVDEDTLQFNRLTLTGRYDEGEIIFKARSGRTISLEKLHESIWATRLSGGTRSGLIKLQITVVGKLAESGKRLTLKPEGAAAFELVADPEKVSDAFQRLHTAVAEKQTVTNVTGYIDGWRGRWPGLLKKQPPRRMVVTGFETKK